MGALGDDDLAELDAALGTAAFTGREHGTLDRFGAAAGQKPGGCVGAVQQAGRPPDDLVLDLRERRERDRVEGVLVEVHQRCLFGDGVHPRSSVEHQAERATVLPASVADAFRLQVGNHIVDVTSLSCQFHTDDHRA